MFSKIGKFLIVFVLITSWVFSGWPQIWNNFPPKVDDVFAGGTTKTFSFTSTIENFIGTSGGKSVLTYDSGTGNPSGSLKTDSFGRNNTDTSDWTWSGTWEDLGVPAGAIVTQLRLDAGYTQVTVRDTVTSITIGPYILRDSSSVDQATLWVGRTPTAVDGAWISIGAQSNQNVPSAIQPSSSSVKLFLQRTINLSSSKTAQATLFEDELSFVITYNQSPNTPTQNSPTNSATGVSITPTFTMTATDPDSDKLGYKVTIYNNSGCTGVVQTNDQSVSSTGWSGMNTSCTASPTSCYTSGTQATYVTQSSLANNTQYWWRASAKDPDGTGTFTNSATCNNFTTISGGNSLPVASAVSIDSGAASITLIENNTKNVVCAGTVTDNDGYTNITSVKADFYRTSVGTAGGVDDNNYYQLVGDSGCIPSGGAGNSETYTCTYTVQYFADATDAGSPNSSDNWTCLMTPSDVVGAGTTASDTIEMDSLMALNVTSLISYGTLNPNNDSGGVNQQTTITNTGNRDMDPQLSGTNMTCSGNTIVVGSQKYSGTAFTFSGGGTPLATTPTTLNITLPQRTSTEITNPVYWGIGIPDGTPACDPYTGTNTFSAVAGI